MAKDPKTPEQQAAEEATYQEELAHYNAVCDGLSSGPMAIHGGLDPVELNEDGSLASDEEEEED